MKIELRTQGIEMTETLRQHTERCLNYGLDWAQEDVDRVIVTLSDINGPRGGNDKRCHLRIPLVRMREVVIEELASDMPVAIARAIDRSAQSLERRLSRQREFGPIPSLIEGD